MEVPSITKEAVFQASESLANEEIVKGYDFNHFSNRSKDYEELFNSFKISGFQATNLALGIEEIDKMVFWWSGGRI